MSLWVFVCNGDGTGRDGVLQTVKHILAKQIEGVSEANFALLHGGREGLNAAIAELLTSCRLY